MDKEMLMMIAIVIGGIVLLVFLGRLLKRHRIVRVIIMATIVISIISYMGIYIYNNQMFFENQLNYYVYGRVVFSSPSTRKIKIRSTKTNLVQGGTDKVIANVKSGTKIVDENRPDEKITLRDIKEGDLLQIYCKEDKSYGEDEPVTAVKVIIKKIE